MTLKSGLAIQCGFAAEGSNPGRFTTPSTFLPMVELPSLTVGGDPVESDSIYTGRTVLTSDQWNGGQLTVGGDTQFEVTDHGLDSIFHSMMGSTSTSGSGTVTRVHTPGSLEQASQTIQFSAPSPYDGLGGTPARPTPLTFAGCHVASWELAFAENAIATLGVTWAGMAGHVGSRVVTGGVTTNASAVVTSATARFTQADVGRPITGTGIPTGATIVSVASSTSCTISAAATAADTGVSLTIGMPLASAVQPTALKPLKTIYLSVTVGGFPVPVKSATFAGDNGLAIDRYFAGSQWPAQPLEADLRTYTGTLECEWTKTLWDFYRSGGELAVTAVASRGGNSITIAGNARFDANPPAGNKRGIIGQSAPIKFIASGAQDSSALSITTVNKDAA